MKPHRKSILSMLDNTVRWTGMPARVADAMSDDPSVDPNHRPMRWSPLLPIVFSCALFVVCLIWPPVLDRISLAVVIAIAVSMMGMGPMIHNGGPLGKPSHEDDEREAALRKDSFLLCLWLLAGLNGLGQPVLMILSHWQHWTFAHSASVAISGLLLNLALLGSVPTLYASWNLPQLPKE